MADDLYALNAQLEAQQKIVDKLAESVVDYEDAIQKATSIVEIEDLSEKLEVVKAILSQSTEKAEVFGKALERALNPTVSDKITKGTAELSKGFAEAQSTGTKAALAGAAMGGVAGGRVGAAIGGTVGMAAGAAIGGVQGIASAAGGIASGNPMQALQGIGQVAGAASQALSAFTGALGQAEQILFGVVVPLARLAAPGVVDRLTMSFEDLQAVFGTVLLPVVSASTAIFDRLNVAFSSIVPTVLPAVQALTDSFGQIAGSSIDSLTPLLQASAEVAAELASQLAPILAEVGAAIGKLTPFFKDMTPQIRAAVSQLQPFVLYLQLLANQFSTVVAAVTLMRDAIMTGAAMIAITFERLRDGNIRGALNFAATFAEARRRIAAADQAPGNGRIVAAREASITTIERVGENARSVSFGRGAAEQAFDQREQQIRLLDQINAALRNQRMVDPRAELADARRDLERN